jgi:chemotaxis protein CheD
MESLFDVGMKNTHFALRYLATEQIKIETEDIGLNCPSKVLFEPTTAKAFVKSLPNDTLARRERNYRHKIDKNHSLEGSVELF